MKKLVLFAALVAVVSFASCKKEQKAEMIDRLEEVTTEEVPEGDTGDGEAAPAEGE
ncbi:hypothetical protein AGMMS49965_20520 [Bacteroidia bacterium]|nr:hypothetical protein AGMMS49965_20520 [Bacteroidia bacterium]